MNKKIFAVFFIFAAFGIQGLFSQEFTWHLALVKDDEGLPFDKTVSMNNGETFSINLFAESDCYAYLIVEGASGTITPIIYRKIEAGNVRRVRYTLSPPAGQERFYIVTSSGEQKELLDAIEAYNKDKTARNSQMIKNLLFEIRDSGDDIPGKPVAFTGSARGSDGSDIQGTEFSGASAYAKTIVISH